MRLNRYVLASLTACTALVVVGGGAALAASGDGTHGSRCDALLAKIAEKRGVSVEQLEADVKARLIARIDAAEKSGRLSKERADALRQRIKDFEPCARGQGARPAARPLHGMLKAAADFLDLSAAQLRAQLPGTSLAGLAQKQGKELGDLEDAMTASGEARIAKALADGKLTKPRADALAGKLEAFAHRLATHVFPKK
jgi:hypothetical protein